MPSVTEKRKHKDNFMFGRHVSIANREDDYDYVIVRNDEDEEHDWWENGDVADMLQVQPDKGAYKLRNLSTGQVDG